MSKPKRFPPPGQLRRSQVVTTFGPGAMVDLPEHSILVGGLDLWTDTGREQIHERRLSQRISELLELGDREIPLYTPPVDNDDPQATQTGVTCLTFPTWFIAQYEQIYRDPTGQEYRSRPLVHWNRLVRGKYLAEDRKKYAVVPVRFVQACPNGHISDIDWYRFVHDGKPPQMGQLWIDEGGTGADLTEIFVRCEVTGARRSLGLAKAKDSKVLGPCHGERPWLGNTANEPCWSQDDPSRPEFNRLLVRSATHAYFAQVVKAISLPEVDQHVREAVEKQWEDELKYLDDLDELRRLRSKRKPKVEAALGELDDEAIWAEIERRKQPEELQERKSIKQAEIETLLSDAHDGREDGEHKFLARKRELDNLPPPLRDRITRIVLVERLREVRVQIGFTRFDAPSVDIDDSLTLPVRPAALARELEWLPAVELLGEGVFIGFNADMIREKWLKDDAVKARGKHLKAGFDAWRKRRDLPDTITFPGLPYVMLHTLSHLLITAVSLECGYSASAIGERIYAGSSGYGILLYTGTPGSEGTLGGLVEVGRRIEHHLAAALELGRLCSSDPICAQHQPANAHEERFLHGAACHGCVLISESSCERRNDYLDRALVVSTLEGHGAEFFGDGAGA
jgi:hypothetical protein